MFYLTRSFLISRAIFEQTQFRPRRSWNVLSWKPSGDRIARSCRHTAPDLTLKKEVKDRIAGSQNTFWDRCRSLLKRSCRPSWDMHQTKELGQIYYFQSFYFRKILVSVKFVSAILGPEMGAPILWTPGKSAFFLQEKAMSIKFPFFFGGFWRWKS